MDVVRFRQGGREQNLRRHVQALDGVGLTKKIAFVSWVQNFNIIDPFICRRARLHTIVQIYFFLRDVSPIAWLVIWCKHRASFNNCNGRLFRFICYKPAEAASFLLSKACGALLQRSFTRYDFYGDLANGSG